MLHSHQTVIIFFLGPEQVTFPGPFASTRRHVMSRLHFQAWPHKVLHNSLTSSFHPLARKQELQNNFDTQWKEVRSLNYHLEEVTQESLSPAADVAWVRSHMYGVNFLESERGLLQPLVIITLRILSAFCSCRVARTCPCCNASHLLYSELFKCPSSH